MSARVLVVDDKPHLLELVGSILEGTYEVTRAPDGGAALALIESEPFDVVVSDIRMPRADGFAVLSAVRRRSAETQVVLLTGYASIQDAVAAIRKGAYDYVEKPFDPADLALVVARALERRRAGTGQVPWEVPGAAGAAGAPGRRTFREAVAAARDRASRDYLIWLMRKFGGNVTQACREAGLERESLHRLLRQAGVRTEQFKRAC
jgi:DNA-binding NtrC family response regulator